MQNELKIIKLFNLEKYFKELLLNNKANTAPYHNYFHTSCVMRNAYFIGKSLDMNFNELRMLCIAALFHDFNHSKGKLKDNENVQIAIDYFLSISSETDELNIQIVDIIKATEYPYTIEDSNLSIFQKAIRDADMLQCFESNYIQQCIFGLMNTEFKVPFEKSLDGQIDFFQKMHFYTEYGQSKYDQQIASNIEDIDYIKSIIN